MLCQACGATLIQNADFCGNCGRPLGASNRLPSAPLAAAKAGFPVHERARMGPSGLLSRLFSTPILESWWLGAPRKLRPYSETFSLTWSNGIYLTAWPRLAVGLPLVTLLFGFFEGATHWSPFTIDGNHLSTTLVAVAFMQMFHLLFLAVFLGSLSADLGLMLVIGFALGDYLVAGPFLTIGSWTPINGFLFLRLPLLYSYWIFFGLAVVPTLVGGALLTPFWRRFPKNVLPWVVVRVAASAIVQMLLVYSWIPLATITVRIVWSWAGQAPPLNIVDYSTVLNPWLPIAAGIGVVARGFLVRRAIKNQLLEGRVRRVLLETQQADKKPGWTRCLPQWLRAVFSGLASAALLSGLIGSWWLGALVSAVLVGLYLLRNCILPAIDPWMKWTRTIERVPLILRVAATTVATYSLSLWLLELPGWSAAFNGRAGQFQAELACIGAGLLITVVLMPFVPAHVDLAPTRTPMPLSSPAVRAAAAIVLIAFALFTSAPAYAICLDPSCCFGGNGNAALAIAAGALALGLLAVGGGFFALGALGEAAAAGELGAGALGAGELGAEGLGAGELGAGLGAGELGAGELGAGELGAGESGAGELGATESGLGEPGALEPGSGEPGPGGSGLGEPGSGEPGTDEPGSGEPGAEQSPGDQPVSPDTQPQYQSPLAQTFTSPLATTAPPFGEAPTLQGVAPTISDLAPTLNDPGLGALAGAPTVLGAGATSAGATATWGEAGAAVAGSSVLGAGAGLAGASLNTGETSGSGNGSAGNQSGTASEGATGSEGTGGSSTSQAGSGTETDQPEQIEPLHPVSTQPVQPVQPVQAVVTKPVQPVDPALIQPAQPLDPALYSPPQAVPIQPVQPVTGGGGSTGGRTTSGSSGVVQSSQDESSKIPKNP